MKGLASPLLAALLVPGLARAGRQPTAAPPPLTAEHTHPSGAFSFRTPADWKVGPLPGRSDAWQASSGPLAVRFVYQAGENGLDSVHVACMLERLAGPMEMEPRVRYEYDFVGARAGDHRALDSAFAVRYDQPIQGHRDWRQRCLTVVGGGHSLCVALYAPSALWKKSAPARALGEAVLGSVSLRARP